MDEEISIINEKTRNEKIKNFLSHNKRLLIIALLTIILSIIGFFSYDVYKDREKKILSDKYNKALIEYDSDNKNQISFAMQEIVKDKDNTYSPLALYFLIDNNLIDNKKEANRLFDILIYETNLEIEIKNLIIYKKALFNSDSLNENELLEILKPLFNSKSVWKSHGLYLAAEYFYSKNQKQKSKEFFNEIIRTENANQDIIKEAQKRLSRDLSE
tara:strand:+ start:81 stop:725 length:645 start_codon:yes stop_codon:yes gene_type:complete